MGVMVLKFRDVKFLTSQHKSLVCAFKIRKVKDTKENFASRRKIGKLKEGSIRSDFILCVKDFKEVDEFVKGSWKVLKGTLLDAKDKTYGWTKGPTRHTVTW